MDDHPPAPLWLRALGALVLASMVAAGGYAISVALSQFSKIGV